MSAAQSGATPRYHIIREAELDHARQNGHRLRAYCPVHGSDHQRSLDIECEGDAAGWGVCRSCSARVFVPELARPDVAARILSGERSGPRPPRPITAADMLRPPRRLAARSVGAPAVTIGPELAQLRALGGRMRARLADEHALSYLAARRIPLEVAQAYGVGYIPADARLAGALADLARWRERIMFPLGTPVVAGMAGPGYIGRSLWGWTAELDELAHKTLLEGTPGAPLRWLKTQAPAGWFNYATLAGAETAIIVEGAFDALALLAACVGEPVVALAGTAAHVEWIPPSVRGVVLALDGDAGGQSAAATLGRDLRDAGVAVIRCAPPDDGLGKDWAARWRVAEWDGLAPVYDALARLDSALEGASSVPAFAQHRPASTPEDAPAAPSVSPASAQRSPADALEGAPAKRDAELWSLARSDPVVTLLEAHGYILADVYAVAS